MILEDQYKQLIEELAEKKEHLKTVRPATAQMKRDEHKIKLLENNLDQALIRYNDIQTTNKRLRQEIDVMRKDQRNQLRVNKNLTKDIMGMSDTARKMNTNTYSGSRLSEETNNQILALKANHEIQKLTFERNIKSLQDKLKEKDQREEELEEDKKKALAGLKASKDAAHGKTKVTGAVATQEFSNPVAVLKLRLGKWTTNNKEKKNLMDMYVRNVKIIEDAFDQIKEATGISSTEEIVTTFIKAEE
jgi:coiled-coil domain-containing protein 63/114